MLYDSPFDKLCPIMAAREVLDMKEREEPKYFKEILSSLGPQELDKLKECFRMAEECQRRGI